MGFLQDAFSFQKSRYTTVEELSEDIFNHIKSRVDNLSRKLSSREQVTTVWEQEELAYLCKDFETI